MRSGGRGWKSRTVDLGRLSSARGGGSELRRVAVAQLAPVPLQVCLTFITAAALTPEDRGSAVFVVSTATLLGSVLFGSLHVGGVAALKAGDAASFRRVNICVAALVAAMVVGVILVATLRPSEVGLYNTTNALQILAGLTAYIPFLYCSRILQGLGRAASFRTLNLLLVGSYALAVTLALLLLGFDNPQSVTLPWLGAVFLASGTSLVLLARALRDGDHVRTPLPARVTALRLSMAAHFGSMSQQLANRADVLILGIFATASVVGVYTFAVSLGQLVWLIAEVAALVVFSDDDLRRRTDWGVQVRERVWAVLRLTTVGGLAIVAASAAILFLLLPSYAEGFTILLIVLPGMVVSAQARIVLAAFSALDERGALFVTACGTLLLCSAYLPAIAFFGVLGAAVASSAIYFGQFFLVRAVLTRATT